MTIDLIISGRPITKKNGMMRTKHGIIQSPQYRQYEADALWQIPATVRLGIDQPCNVRCVYHMPTRGKVDLLNLLSATCDILVKAGVIADDNSRIVTGHDGSRVLYDKERPRVEVRIDTEVTEI